MMDYEFLEHTADVKFRAYGKDIEEAFKNAVKATSRVLTDDNVVNKISKTFTKEARNREALLYDLLDEIVFLLDTENFIPADADIRIKDNKLQATLYGDHINNYELAGDIKSVTYNEMSIEENDKVTVQVVLDI